MHATERRSNRSGADPIAQVALGALVALDALAGVQFDAIDGVVDSAGAACVSPRRPVLGLFGLRRWFRFRRRGRDRLDPLGHAPR